MGLFRRLVRWGIGLAVVLAGAFLLMLVVWRSGAPVSTLMLAREATGRSVERSWVPLAQISPNLTAAVIASEDGQFCRHHGVDWGAVREVIDTRGGPTRGASTIAT